MCARRFLILIFILTLIVVGGSFAIYQWGGEALVRMATPVGHYQEPPRGSGPDYRLDSSWLAKPSLPQDPSRWVPSGAGLPVHPASGAVFYIHPTTYLERDLWNAPLSGNAESDRRAELFVRSQGSALKLAGAVWAPRYRQAAYGAFLLKSDDAQKALDLAYRDVRDAFDIFLAAQSRDVPIVLAGHSQGSMHLLRLLADRKEQLKGRLTAAYVVGWPVGLTSDLPATGLPACTVLEQAGCLLSWQSFKEPENTDLVTEAWVGTKGLTGVERTQGDMLCTNPLSGMKDGVAAAAANQGVLVPNGDFSDAALVAGRVGARCDRGFLIIDGDVPNLGPYVLPGNNYHVYDYALFWGSIRADAERRVTAWRAR
jgi:hypothetical protein